MSSDAEDITKYICSHIPMPLRCARDYEGTKGPMQWPHQHPTPTKLRSALENTSENRLVAVRGVI